MHASVIPGGWAPLFLWDPGDPTGLLFIPMTRAVVRFTASDGTSRRVAGLRPRLDATADGIFLVLDRLFPGQTPSTYEGRIALECITEALTSPCTSDFQRRDAS